MDDAWKTLRRQLMRERASYAKAQADARSKNAKEVFAALEGAYGGVLRMMDKIEATATGVAVMREP